MKLLGKKGHFANNMNDKSDINNVNVFIDHFANDMNNMNNMNDFENDFANDFVNTKVNNTKSKNRRHSTK